MLPSANGKSWRNFDRDWKPALSPRDDQGRLCVPGLGLPVQHLPPYSLEVGKDQSRRSPHAIADNVTPSGVTVRERRMLQFIDNITDKPDWHKKVFNETIVARWRAEAAVYKEELKDVILSSQMLDYCIAELREKGKHYDGYYNPRKVVGVLDAEATLVKSDEAVSTGLKKLLSLHANILELVPEHMKDWHPGSNGQVLNLLHPSLFPLVYGTTRVLPSHTVPLESCVQYSGAQELAEHVKGPGEETTIRHESSIGWEKWDLPAWGNFQWLPSDIMIEKRKSIYGHDSLKIVSYINNLHPELHSGLYDVLALCVKAAIPLWNEALSWFHNRKRIPHSQIGSDSEDCWLDPPADLIYEGPASADAGAPIHRYKELEDVAWEVDGERRVLDDMDWDNFYNTEEHWEWTCANRILIQPEPKAFVPFKDSYETRPTGAKPVDLEAKFGKTGLQVIFKLANIHLTPEQPSFSGGSWHIEGALNEHICATAIYYYDENNITESHLAFRQTVDVDRLSTLHTEDTGPEANERYYGLQDVGISQVLGSVSTREGRMIAFPNVLQHCVQPFKLKDETKPGHRKILAMFLVDPHIRVISTANVPPQQRDWWAMEVHKHAPFTDLPQEIFDHIISFVDDPISWERAAEIRQDLMNERGAMSEKNNQWVSDTKFSFCEH